MINIKLGLLFLFLLVFSVFSAACFLGVDSIKASVKVTPVQKNDQLIIFDGTTQELIFPDEDLGLQTVGNGLRVHWPLDGESDYLTLHFEFDTIDISSADNLMMEFRGESGCCVILRNFRFISAGDRSWTYDSTPLGNERLESNYVIDLIKIPAGIKKELAGLEINLLSQFNPGDITIGKIWVSGVETSGLDSGDEK